MVRNKTQVLTWKKTVGMQTECTGEQTRRTYGGNVTQMDETKVLIGVEKIKPLLVVVMCHSYNWPVYVAFKDAFGALLKW